VLPSLEQMTQAATEVAQKWALQVDSIEMVSHSENAVFKIHSPQGAYALRIHRPGYNNLEELNSEVKWEQALNAANISTPIHVPTADGAYYVSAALEPDRTHHIGLIEWMDGDLLSHCLLTADEQTRATYLHQLGVLMARLHQQASDWIAPPGFTRRCWDAHGLIGTDPLWGRFWQSPALTPKEQHYLADIQKKLYARLKELPVEPTNFGLIHADLHPDNVMLRHQRTSIDLCAFDFDDSGFGWHGYDVAVALHRLTHAGQNLQDQQHFLTGYRTLRSLPEAEVLLPVFYLVRSLLTLGWISDRPEVMPIRDVKTTLVPTILDACEQQRSSI